MFRAIIFTLVAGLGLSACDRVARGTANTAGFAARTAVQGGYEAGRLIYRGGRYVVVGGESSGRPERDD